MAALLKAPMDKFTATERRKLLEGDSQLIIVAGSDTTAATLTSMVYELLRAPKYIDMLRDELAPFVQGDVIDFRRIQTLPILNGIVNETHRLHPPVPTTLSRRTPSEGIMVGDTHVPGNMTVWCPQYAIGRTESLYKDAGTFFPERWYSRPDTITDKTVFAPFSVGAYACIGKSLALQNIRNTIAEIVINFEIRTGVVDDVRSFEDKTLDHFTMGLPALRVHFDKRGC
ncbi:cytochrome P450, partial [Metarhizium majus ARSEF 297]